jgi:hypothetical protein
MQASMGAGTMIQKQAFILELSAFEFEKLCDALKRRLQASIQRPSP